MSRLRGGGGSHSLHGDPRSAGHRCGGGDGRCRWASRIPAPGRLPGCAPILTGLRRRLPGRGPPRSISSGPSRECARVFETSLSCHDTDAQAVESVRVSLEEEAKRILAEDIAINEAMGRHGAPSCRIRGRSLRIATPGLWPREDTARPWASSARRLHKGRKSRCLPMRPGRSFRARG